MISGVIAGGRPYAAAGGGGGPTTIGEAFGGGYYIGNIVIGSDTYAIIMAGLSGESTQKWKSGATSTSGTSDLDDGAANTASMMSGTAHAAAVYCDSYVSGVYADWYLPAKNELYLAWVSRSSLAALSLGVSDYYWSSTQYASGLAWRQYFSSGLQDWYNKAYSFKVRPVRRIIL